MDKSLYVYVIGLEIFRLCCCISISVRIMCYMEWLKLTGLYVTVTVSVEWQSHEIDIVTATYRPSEF